MIRAWTTMNLMMAIVMMVMLVGAAGLAQPAAGQGMEAEVGRGGPWGRDGGTALPFLIRSANLTPEQETKVRTILSAHPRTAAARSG